MSGHMLIVNSAATEFRGKVADDFGSSDVECPSCGGKDNHCRARRGLCVWCACALGYEVGTDAFEAMPRDELVRRAKDAREKEVVKGKAPKIKATARYGSGFKCAGRGSAKTKK